MSAINAGRLERVQVRAHAAPRGRRFPGGPLLVHALLIASIAVVAFPLYFAFAVSTQNIQQVVQRPPRLLPSSHMFENYAEAWRKSNMGTMLVNSALMAVTVAAGKILISMLSAFAIVYFSFRGRMLCFWMIFVTLMLPVPVRLMSTYEVVGTLGWLNSYQGLTVPLMASATATFLFRQFYLTIPNELAEAAQLDGAGPMRFLFQFPGIAFFDCEGIRLMLSAAETPGQTFSSVVYFKVPEIQPAADALKSRGVSFEKDPHVIARMPDHNLWMAFFRDPDRNLLALMTEVPR